MRHQRSLLGFRPKTGYGAVLGGRRYLISRADLRTLDQLMKMREAIDPDSWPGKRLVTFRSEIRHMIANSPSAVLCEVILKTNDDLLCRLALWLRGRCGGTIGTQAVATRLDHPNPIVRREAARSLRRLGGWSHLNLVLEHETDASVRAMARQPKPVEFADRLNRLIQDVQVLPNSPSTQSLYISPDVDLKGRTKPKSIAMIRRILWRIRALLHGNRSTY